ncbi:MAG: hypothetical protein BroJett007_33240 [Chloroflexota bacterium]|nr:MAG: hypothetical protein BroJett007_33240 [Chloroflexota bacterium]
MLPLTPGPSPTEGERGEGRVAVWKSLSVCSVSAFIPSPPAPLPEGEGRRTRVGMGKSLCVLCVRSYPLTPGPSPSGFTGRQF